MLRNLFCATLAVLVLAASSQAALVGSFRPVASGLTSVLHPTPYDTWAFDLNSTESANIEALEFNFDGAFVQVGGVTFRDSASNPMVGPFEAPDCFFVVPAGTPSGNVLVGSSNDNATTLAAAYTLAGGASLGNPGSTNPVAFFSVPVGTMMGADNFNMGQAAIGGVLVPITLVTDPGGESGITVSPDSGDFGTVFQGSIQQQMFTIQNPGTAALTLGTPDLTGAFDLVGGFPTSIDPGGMANFSVAFDTANLGNFGGLLSFGTNVPGLPTFTLDFSGRVIPEPSTAALCGLAMVGLVGLIRRRD